MSAKLLRGLTFIDATAIVIGTIIGTGVFLKTATMAQLVGNPWSVLLAWVAAGLLSLTGALTYAELGSLMPEAGGEYVYLKEGHGDLWAFLYGWMRFWIASPGSIAAYSVGAMTFMGAVLNINLLGGKTFASIFMILFFSMLNCFSVAFGGKLQAFMTALKMFMILGISFGIFFFSHTSSFDHFFQTTSAPLTISSLSAFGSAVVAALWAYDGWCNLTMVAGEIKDPQKNIPRSLITGMICILLIYVVANLAFFYALPFHEILSSNSSLHPESLPVATKAALTFLGSSGVGILSAAFVFSALGAMNGSILTGSRVPFAMARDGLFFKKLAVVSEKGHVPITSIIVQACVASLLAFSGTFDQLTDYVVFSSWIFYALVTSVVFIMRKRKPLEPRAYKTFGYPFLPLLFILVGVLLLINTIMTNPQSTLVGIGFILSGVPCYFFFKRRKFLHLGGVKKSATI